MYFCVVFIISPKCGRTQNEGTTFYLLNFPLANYHLETGIIEQTLTSRSMRSHGVDSPLMLKGCGRPARGNGGLRRFCVYTLTVLPCQTRQIEK